MNLERLRLFVEIVESGSISEASRRVSLTQPAVSRNLKCLEEELEVELFERVGHRLVLTAAGRALLPRARDLLGQVEQVQREVKRRGEQRYFDVRLGATHSVILLGLPGVLVALRQSFPDLEVKLTGGKPQALIGMLEDDALDLALIEGNAGTEQHGQGNVIGTYAVRFWGRADLFPTLATIQHERDLQRFPMIEVELVPGQPSLIKPRRGSFAVAASVDAVKALILAGFGVGALQDFMLTAQEREALVSAPVMTAGRGQGSLRLAASPWRQDQALTQISSFLTQSLGQRLQQR